MLSEKSIQLIRQLIVKKTELKDYYKLVNKKKEASQITFRLKNYHKWINIIIEQSSTIDEINDESKIKELNISESLKKKLIEIMQTGNIKDISETALEIDKINTQLEEEHISEPNGTNEIDVSTQTNGTNDSNTNPMDTNIMWTDSRISPKQSPIPKRRKKGDVPTLDKKKSLQSQRPKNGVAQILFDLQRVYGIGPSNAKKMAEKGFTLQKLLDEWEYFCELDSNNHIIMLDKLANSRFSHRDKSRLLEDKLKNTIYLKQLTHHQLVGVKYFYDIERRIARAEIDKINSVLSMVCSKLNPDINGTICGSYRRGCSSSGDIDFLITHPCCKMPEDFKTLQKNPLSELVRVLASIDFLVDHLTIDGDTKYMGLCQLKNFPHARRIDIRFIPYNCYGAATLYFTGSRDFNTAMRSHCLSKGYTLNEYGLYKLEFDKHLNKEVKAELIPTKTEEDIFKFLDYPYKTPEERNIIN